MSNHQNEYEGTWNTVVQMYYEYVLPSRLFGTGEYSYNIVENREDYSEDETLFTFYGWFSKDWE